ncbi:CHAT domain-containing protein [Coprinopsis sp. MPI-PUGE-AT-0042]|nr:CHAT domain-containing protein [Coprinopsis sp. MPI-PUGE-AT-0042]
MHAIAMNHLGAMYHVRFSKTMSPEDLEHALWLYQTAVELSRPQFDIHAECLRGLAQGYHARYRSMSNFVDSIRAITALTDACKLTRNDPQFLESGLGLLMPWLQEYFEYHEQNRSSAFLGMATLASLQQIMEATPEDSARPLLLRMKTLATLIGALLWAPWAKAQTLINLQDLISNQQLFSSLLLPVPSIPNNSPALHELPDPLMLRKEPTRLDEAITVGNEALDSGPKPFDGISLSLSASLHFQRYEKLHFASDLNDSIILQRRLINSMRTDDPSYLKALHDLAQYLCTRLMASNMESDIDEALASSSKGLALTHQDPYKHLLFERFQVFALHRKFLLTRNIDHIDTAASMLLQSQCYTSSTGQLRSHMGLLLSELAASYWGLYCTSRSIEFMHKLIACSQKHVAMSSTPMAYHQLGYSLLTRYAITESRCDLVGAIKALSTSIEMSEATGDDPKPRLLLDLSLALTLHDKLEPDLKRLAQARKLILRALSYSKEHDDIHQEAMVELIANRSAHFASHCRFHCRAERPGEDVKLEPRTISPDLSQNLVEAEGLIRRVSPLSPHYLRGQACVYLIRMTCAEITDNHQHLEDLIKQAKNLFHHDQSQLLNVVLGGAYRFSDNPHHRDLAFQEYRREALDTQNTVLNRFKSAKAWVADCRFDNAEESLDAYDTAIGLLAMAAGLGQRIMDRHHHVAEPPAAEGYNPVCGATLPLEAAARAVQCGRIDKALEWLEQGRCLVWNQLQTLRTPLDGLEEHDSQLAKRILAVSALLEDDGTVRVALGEGLDLDFEAKTTLAEDSANRARLSKEWDELLSQVRKISGFEDFLRPTRCSTILQNLPGSGAVVILNADESRCDAIVLAHDMGEPMLVPLPRMTYFKAQRMQQSLEAELVSGGVRMRESLQDEYTEGHAVEADEEGVEERGAGPKRCRSAMERMLRELWESVVKPVLDALGPKTISTKPSARIWWCPTGPFSFLPIHAAGIHGPGTSSECLADYAVSSYTPTVSALITRVKGDRERKAGDTRLLLVSVPEAEGLKPIHGTTKEVRALCNFATANDINNLPLEGEEATAEKVMEEISKATIVHFACHGSQNGADPMRSCFSLQDQNLELATIIKANLKNADLAFLSACQTGTGDQKLSNEAVHLAAGMLAAGFRGTVATMWGINDAHAPKVSEDFYRNLVERGKAKGGGIDGEDAAFALHYATQELKKRLGGAEKSFLTWVPYVHYGL